MSRGGGRVGVWLTKIDAASPSIAFTLTLTNREKTKRWSDIGDMYTTIKEHYIEGTIAPAGAWK